jgi:hypothetical protein
MQRMAGHLPEGDCGRARSSWSDSPPGFENSMPDSKAIPSGAPVHAGTKQSHRRAQGSWRIEVSS